MSSNAPIPDTAQVLINWSVHGVLVQNVEYFRALSPPVTQTSLDLLRFRVGFLTQNNFKNGLGAGTILRSIECIDRSPTSTLTSNVVLNSATFNSIPALPSSIALGLIQYVSAPTEVHPSRAFITGIPENRVTGNDFDPVWANSTRGLWATNNASHGSFGWRHVRVSLYLAGAPRALGVTSDINGYALQSLTVSNQRRRLHP